MAKLTPDSSAFRASSFLLAGRMRSHLRRCEREFRLLPVRRTACHHPGARCLWLVRGLTQRHRQLKRLAGEYRRQRAPENTPALQVNVSGQYTQPLDGGYSLTGRVEYYWQSHMWGRVWQDPADLIQSWNTTSALLTLNSPDNRWYVQGFIRNIFNHSNITGEYLTSSSSGL